MIVITGISGGIGNYLYSKYFSIPEPLIGTYHLHKPIGSEFTNAKAVDITSTAEIHSFLKNELHQLSSVTLINCAGVSYNSFAHRANIADWANVINVNLTGTFNIIHALLPLMREQNFGRIINLSSIVAQFGVIGTSAYAASKAGINGMIKSIALENAQKGITINNINLGYFNLGMINLVPEEMQKNIKSKIALKEFGEPENIFNTIEYIRSTPYLTGSCIDLNGGLM